jgi:hypothetical protein
MIKTNVKVRGPTNGISNKYNKNYFYYSTGNHIQRRFQSDDLSLIAHYKLLTRSYLINTNTFKYYQEFMMITYVNNKSSSFHSIGIGYTIQLAMKDQTFIVPSVIQHKSRLTFNKKSIKN